MSDADARRGEHLSGGRLDRLAQRVLNAEGDANGVVLAANRLEEHEKLVARRVGHGVFVAKAGVEPAPDRDQHLVARLVAEAVDDPAETVDVDRQHGEAEFAVSLGAFDGVRQPVGEQRAVRKPGERVAERCLLELVRSALEDADAGTECELGAERRGELAEELDLAISPDTRRVGEDTKPWLRRALAGFGVVARLLEWNSYEGTHAVVEARGAAFGPLDE